MCSESSIQGEPERHRTRRSRSMPSYQDKAQPGASSVPARAEECRQARSLSSVPCKSSAKSDICGLSSASGHRTLRARIAAFTRFRPRTRRGLIRVRKARRWSSTLQFGCTVPPAWICFRCDLVTALEAGAVESGKKSVSIISMAESGQPSQKKKIPKRGPRGKTQVEDSPAI